MSGLTHVGQSVTQCFQSNIITDVLAKLYPNREKVEKPPKQVSLRSHFPVSATDAGSATTGRPGWKRANQMPEV